MSFTLNEITKVEGKLENIASGLSYLVQRSPRHLQMSPEQLNNDILRLQNKRKRFSNVRNCLYNRFDKLVSKHMNND